MRRALGLALLLALAGCGDDTTTLPTSMDLAQPLIDLSMPGLSCGGMTCAGSCAACLSLLGGVCATPCKTAMPSSCAAPATCHAATGGDGGASVTFGGSCAGFDGYCG